MKRERTLKPPRGLFLSTRLIYDAQLSPTLKETLFQLMALAWGRKDHTTPILSYPLLETLTGKDVRTLHGHVAALKTYHAALRLQPVDRGQFLVTLSDWLFSNESPFPDGRNRQLHDEEEEEEISDFDDFDSQNPPLDGDAFDDDANNDFVDVDSQNPHPHPTYAASTGKKTGRRVYQVEPAAKELPEAAKELPEVARELPEAKDLAAKELPVARELEEEEEPENGAQSHPRGDWATRERPVARELPIARNQPVARNPLAKKPAAQEPPAAKKPPAVTKPPAARERPEAARKPPVAKNTPGPISEELRREILASGVFSGLLRELGEVITRERYSSADVLALINWCRFESPGNPGALLVTRLRLGARAPQVYHQAPCRRCGMFGEHHPSCPQRYVIDED